MSEENIKVITQKEELYEHCENVEQLFDKFYIPLLNIHYKKTYDLQQKVEQLEKENKELKEENKRIFQNVNDDELLISNAMNYAELKKAEKRVEQLENIRKEAIEYIENNWITYNDSKDFTEFNEELPVFIKEINILLNILNKGE